MKKHHCGKCKREFPEDEIKYFTLTKANKWGIIDNINEDVYGIKLCNQCADKLINEFEEMDKE